MHTCTCIPFKSRVNTRLQSICCIVIGFHLEVAAPSPESVVPSPPRTAACDNTSSTSTTAAAVWMETPTCWPGHRTTLPQWSPPTWPQETITGHSSNWCGRSLHKSFPKCQSGWSGSTLDKTKEKKNKYVVSQSNQFSSIKCPSLV